MAIAPACEARRELHDWLRFVETERHVLERHPGLLTQQAVNQPTDSAVGRRAAARLAAGDWPRRPWLHWLNRPPERTACRATLVGHDHWVTDVAVTPDGRFVLSAAPGRGQQGGEIRVWDSRTGRHLLTRAIGGRVLLALLPDGRRVVSGHADPTRIAVWEVDTGRDVCLLDAGEPVRAVSSVPDGRRLVSAGETLRVFDVESGEEMHRLRGHAGPVRSLAAFADGCRIASAGEDRTVRIWDLEQARELLTLRGHDHAVTAVAATADGSRVMAFGGYEQTALVAWELGSGSELFRIKVGQSCCFAVTPDGRRLVLFGGGEGIEVRDAWSGDEIGRLRGHRQYAAVNALLVASADRLLSAGSDRTVRVWNLNAYSELQTLRGHTDSVRALALGPDGELAASGSDDETVRIWDLQEAARGDDAMRGHSTGLSGIALSPDGRRVLSSSDWAKDIKVWDASSGRELMTLRGHGYLVSAIAVTHDSSRVVSASLDQTCKVWDLRSGRLLRDLKGNYGESFRNLVITPDGRFLAATANVLGRRIRLWNLETGRRRLAFWFHRGDIDALATTPDGCIVSGGQDGIVRLWDPVSRLPIRAFKKHSNWVSAVAVSPDGSRVVSGSWDETVKVWDVRSGEELLMLRGHAARIRSLGITPDGRRILSDGDDGTLRVWDALDGRELLCLESHTHYAADVHGSAPVAITSDGHYVIADRADRTLAVWDLETGGCVLRFPRPAPVDHVATQGNLIAAGDQAGFVHILRIHELEIAPRVVTASRNGYLCPSCGSTRSTPPTGLGTIVECPACGQPLRLNPFIARPAGEGRWWWRLWH